MRFLWRCVKGRGAMVRMVCASVLMLCVVLAMASSAEAIDVDPAVVEQLVRDEKPATIELPSALDDEFHSLSHPDYGSTEPEAVNHLSSDASLAGGEITQSADEAASDPHAEKLIRDCAKKGLEDTAWDLWWSSTGEGQDFSPKEEFENKTLECFETWLEAESGVLGDLAKLIANEVGQGAEGALGSDNDRAGLADWLQVVDYYYVAY